MSRFVIFLTLLLLAGLGAGSYLGCRQHQAQAQLGQVLQQLDATLTTQNDEAAQKAKETLRGIEETIAKNRNQPAELAVLHRARALGRCIQRLCGTLRGLHQQLRQHPAERADATQLLGSGSQARRALRQQLAACADTLRRLGPADPTPLAAPDFDGLPAPDALAALTLLEAQVRARESRTLRHLARPLGAASIPVHFVAAATAERTTVAPGGTYRARLLAVKSLAGIIMRMYCDGRLVPVGPDGVGTVRFRAPTRPGPAGWTAAICLVQNGRDTTFVVRVPFVVARR